ncbi:enoyl-CoA hydratase/isomerase family protein [Desulfovermiculus halophilus]|jgi:2-(1,2-epoxy-1,2-dihydrophenyl)acetyl-CoA isomerase|uniref:enoyl-CoA hydratase/isomerase family protein n=1 Tax=Desulfovermiculus halophilus TaxID=339722 RepID=UPI0004843529|nr:enoyl-CoA hydratase-related protein [Desulfovermiculus halophilus]
MQLQTCRYEHPGSGLGLITLDRPKEYNAINKTMTRELEQVLNQAAKDDRVRVLVLTGSGPAFCAGGDLAWLMEADDQPKKREIVDLAGGLIEKLWHFEKPVLAGVNGVAAGAGTALVLACDMSIAAESARFAPNFVNIAAVPDSAASWLLPRVVGMHRAMELMLSGRTLSASQAYELGLFTSVVPDTEFQDQVREMAGRLAGGPQGAIRSIKALLKASADNDLSRHLEEEAVRQVRAWSDPDFAEGVQAFVHKRTPRFA